MFLRAFTLLATISLAASLAWAGQGDEELKKSLRRVLRENPELILEVLAEHKLELYKLAKDGAQEDQARRWEESLDKALERPLPMPLDEARPVIGPRNAPITILEYSDFLCGACSLGAQNVDKLMQKHPHEVRLQMKHNPSGDLARQLALYYEALGRQRPELAWRFAEAIFQSQEEIGRRKLEAVQEILAGLKVDQAQLSRDLADKSLEENIKKDEAEADNFKFQSTPTFLVNGVAITGAAPVNAFEQVITKWRARHQR